MKGTVVTKYQKSALVLSVILFFFMHGSRTKVSTKNSSNVSPDELIISFNFDEGGEDEAIAFVAGAGFLFVCTSLLLIATRSSKLFYLALALELLTGGGFAAFFWHYKQAKNNVTATIFNEQGVWLQYCGTISWNDIEKVDIVQMPYSSVEAIGLTLKEASLSMVKETKRITILDIETHGYHIFVLPMSVPLERIITFAKRFIE